MCLCWLSLPALASAAQAPEAPQPQHSQDAAPSPAVDARPVVQGRLGNGLRYAILPRRASEPGAGLFMQVQGGFLAERRPGERGLAHLIEHLAFHSPTRSAPDELHWYRTIGLPLSFPEPAGGTTIWRESDYYLVSRTTKPEDIEALLGLFRNVASELIFRADIVDEQRAEVMREMADKRAGNLISARYIAAVAPGSPNDVIDAQNSADVPSASLDAIRALYHRLYRPENTSLVIVGDVDAGEIAALIEKRFGNWRGVGPAPGPAAVATLRSDAVGPVSHSALPKGRRSAMITVASPLPPPARTKPQQAAAWLMDMLAMRAVNERLALRQGPGAPGKYGIFIENGEQGRHRLIMLWDDFAPGGGQAAIAALKRTACDLKTTGLSEHEWAGAKHYLLQDLEARATRMPNFEIARQIADELAVGREPISPGEMLQHARAQLPRIGARAMNAWWRRQWSAGLEHIRVERPNWRRSRTRARRSAPPPTARSGMPAARCRRFPSGRPMN
jgi:predicted Zn-dependent peptidase